MGKVRADIKDDDTALAQWLFRKLRNHDPMSVRVKQTTMAVTPKSNQVVMGMAQFAAQGSAIAIDEQDPTRVYYKLGDGRVFAFHVEEVQGEIAIEKELALA